jgi:hypothetical protein
VYTQAYAAANPAEVKTNTPTQTKAPEPVAQQTVAPPPPPPPPVEPPVVKNEVAKKDSVIAAKKEEKKAIALARAEEKKVIAQQKAEEKKRKQEEKKAEVLAKAEKKAEPKEEKPAPCDPTLPGLGNLKGKSLNEPAVYKELLDVAGAYCAPGVKFRVQIGAYKHPSNFKTDKFSSLGKIESAESPDGITRFTQNEFNTIRDAEKLRQKAISKGVKDAWIVVFMNGTRYTLEEFIQKDFMAQPVN